MSGFKDALELIVAAIAFIVWLIRLENKVKDSSDLAKKIDEIRDEFNDKFTDLERQVNAKFDDARKETRSIISEAKEGFLERMTDVKEIILNAGRTSNR